MSIREQARTLIDEIPEYKLSYVLAYMQGVMADDEAEDDAFCERMYQNYLNNPDPEKDETISGEELAKELGIAL